MEYIKNALFLKGLKLKEKLVVWWFTLTFCLICGTVEAPLWFVGLECVSLGFSSHFLKKIDIPDYFNENEENTDGK